MVSKREHIAARPTSPCSVDLTVDRIPNKLTIAQGQVQGHLDPAWEQVGGRGRQNVPVRPAGQLINLRCDEIQDKRQASTSTDVIQLRQTYHVGQM